MNKFLLFALFLGLFSYSNAQISVENDSVYAEFDTDDSDLPVYNKQFLVTAPATIKWQFLSVDVPSDWTSDYFVCDYVQCWDETTNESEYTIPDTKPYPLDVHFLNNNNVGTGVAKLLIWDVSDSLNTVRVVTYATKVDLASSVSSLEALDVSIYPNPIVNTLTIENIDVNTIEKVSLYNIVGSKVYETTAIKSNQTINVSSLNSGMYILQLTDKENTNYTQKIIKQ